MRYISLVLCFIAAACGQKESTSSSEKVQVLSTVAMIDDLVKQIGGDVIETSLLVVGELDPHSYELVKGDGDKLDRADIIFSNGLGLEHGASLYYRLKNSDRVVSLGNYLLEYYEARILQKDGIVDPHVWMDISLWMEVVDPIVERLSHAIPHEAEGFAARGKRLKEELLAVHEEIYASLRELESAKRYLVTSHDAFAYFARAYLAEEGEPWNARCIAPEGIAPEGQMGLLDIQRVVDHLCSFAVPVVFPESNLSRDSLQKIVSVCKQRGQTVVLANEPLCGDAFGQSDSYVGMMRHNCEIMKRYMR